jgi:hypothetical protein
MEPKHPAHHTIRAAVAVAVALVKQQQQQQRKKKNLATVAQISRQQQHQQLLIGRLRTQQLYQKLWRQLMLQLQHQMTAAVVGVQRALVEVQLVTRPLLLMSSCPASPVVSAGICVTSWQLISVTGAALMSTCSAQGRFQCACTLSNMCLQLMDMMQCWCWEGNLCLPWAALDWNLTNMEGCGRGHDV